ncbi:hypothetical protein F5B21DRAFT_493782 [Xylaria acuta]|nr:hypothetical protein F5B21DRAFT_493782 [Xylaria acuta]
MCRRPAAAVLFTDVAEVGGMNGAVLREALIRRDHVRSGRRLLITDRDFVDIGPDWVRKGDIIALLIVLRRGGEHWRFVGECYIRGIRHGKRWMALIRGHEWEAIEIC